MIVSYQHRKLELYATKCDRSKLQQSHVQRIKLILKRLDAAKNPQMMNQPSYNFYSLSGDIEGLYAVKVNGNWRIIFRFVGENAYDVDYLDYHKK